MAAGFNQTSDLYDIYNVVQNTMIRFPKDMIVSSLREYFAEDSYYHYVRDEWGFPKIPEHTDLAPGAGINNDVTTRIYIGEFHRFDGIYYPAVLVRSGGSKYVPISLSRNKGGVQYENTRFVDGYGNETVFSTPSVFFFDGAWEGSINIDILTRGIKARDDLVELISIFFTELRYEEFYKAGIAIKPSISIGAPGEGEDRNDKLYKQSITLDIRTEWRREIPVTNILDIINFCADLGNLETTPHVYSPNLTINTTVELLDAIQNL